MHRKFLLLFGCLIILLALVISACSNDDDDDEPAEPDDSAEVNDDSTGEDDVDSESESTGAETTTDGDSVTEFTLTSTAFEEGQPIPVTYTCDGEDVSPSLAWDSAPDNAQSFTLIMDDPDAPGGTWVHWVLFNLPATTTSLPEGVPADFADGIQGQTSWTSRPPAYYGPCPPSGIHRYMFKLYALDTTLGLAAGATKDELLAAMAGHILAETQLMGTFER
ncbi:MAG: YbhB/YbcL family Raf kinase inhibitor-like protein [Chloroflexi bacterium]|nr:YbhB/YbcL family Raf kinase inhibitor-like protein [Chloroflexota bacterium]